MKRHYSDSLEYETFEEFDKLGIPHAIFTRKGGVSPTPWASLNLGGTVGDDVERVRENRLKAFRALHFSIENSFDVWQVHSAKVICVDQPRDQALPYIQADGIVTNQPGIVLFMRFADCVPILFVDPIQKAIGLVHAGWKGTLLKIAEVAIHTMRMKFGSRPADIIAGIGPSIAAHHYPVGKDVLVEAQKNIPQFVSEVCYQEDDRIYFDLWRANQLILQQNGVKSIQLANQCTACHTDDWFSHRAEKGKTGRFGVLISL